jgi:hypothetical protein
MHPGMMGAGGTTGMANDPSALYREDGGYN